MRTKQQILAAFRRYGERQHDAESETEAAPLNDSQLAAQVDRVFEVATKLRPHNATVLLDDPVGSGKTVVALGAAGKLLAAGTVGSVIVAVPNDKVAVGWARRAHWLGLAATGSSSLVTPESSLWKAGEIRVVTQYLLQQRRSLRGYRGDGLVLVDEAHKGLQREGTVTYKRLEKVAGGERLLLISATPFQIQGHGLAAMLGVNRSAQDRSQLQRLFTDYSNALIDWLHARRDAGGDDSDATVAEALAVVERIEHRVAPKLNPHRLSRYRRQVMGTPEPELPEPGPKIDPGAWSVAYHIARVTMELVAEDAKGKGDAVHRMLLSSAGAFREGNGGGKRLAAELAKVGHEHMAEMLFARLGADPYEHPKVAATVDRAMEHVAAGRHVLIFCIFKGTQRDIAEALEKRLDADQVIRPESATALKDDDKTRFRKPQGPPLVIVARDNLSESIDLDGGQPVLIHHDLAWNPARLDQRWGRIVRASSHFRPPDVQYVPLLDLPSEERLYDTMKNRDHMGARLLPIGMSEDADE